MKLRNKKTGEIIELKLIQTNCECLYEHEIDTYYGEPITLEVLNRMCEDYTPQEPLIKDEKVRKAVRAWADALDIENIHVFHEEDIYCIFRSDFSDLEIQFDGSFEEQIKNGTYTIAELCGKEE